MRFYALFLSCMLFSGCVPPRNSNPQESSLAPAPSESAAKKAPDAAVMDADELFKDVFKGTFDE